MTDVITAILLIGAAQGTFLAFVLLSGSRGNRAANRYLGGSLLLFSVGILLHALPHTEFEYGLPFHFELIACLFLCINPLLYGYVRALTSPEAAPLSRRDLLHLVPAALAAAGIPLLGPDSPPGPSHDHAAVPGQTMVYGAAMGLQTVGYVGVMLARLFAHGDVVRESFSSMRRVSLRWLRSLVVAYVFTWLLGFALETLTSIDHPWDYVFVATSVLMYAIGYFGLRQPAIFAGEEQGDSDARNRRKYERSTLSDEAADRIRERLLETFEEAKPYRDGDLTLARLAERLNVSPHHLSQVINERLGMSFFDFVNGHRVEEAKRMLVDPGMQHLNIAGIGLEAGFNSVSAFNAAFKKYAGMTPSQFRKRKEST